MNSARSICSNYLFSSGRLPGKVITGVLLQNVTIVIDYWPVWNYTLDSNPAVSPNIE
jgi:hypothetical protein